MGSIQTLAYVVDRRHEQYAGKLGLDEQVSFVLQGVGQSGANPDYVRATVQHLREMGIHDARLESVAGAITPPRQNLLV
jgi:cation transport protein ChaC